MVDGPFEQLNERAEAYAADRSLSLVSDLEDSTLGKIRDAEARAFREGLTPDQFGEAIDAIIDNPDRADLIAEFELSDAQASAAMDAWRESGVVEGKEWLLSNDHAEDDECNDNADAGVVDLDEDFPSGDDTAPAHPRCDCDVAAVVKESGDE